MRAINPGEILEGSDVSLRLCVLDDVSETYLSWLADPIVNRYLETRWTEQTVDTIRSFVSGMLASPSSYLFAIVEKASGRHVGNVKVGPVIANHDYADVSYFIGDRAAWGRGYATEAVRIATAFGFSRLKLHRLQAGLYETNVGSFRVLEKAGYTYEGRLAKQLRGDHDWEDHVWFGALREHVEVIVGTPRNFAVIGVGGVVAPRHLEAIAATKNRLVAACDTSDSVGILDRFDLGVPFFTEPERFDRHLEKLRHGPEEHRVHYLSVCSPNFLHDAHCRLGLRIKADVICEKPAVINPWNLDPLEELEAETGHRVWTVLQLRTHDRLIALRDELRRAGPTRHDVVLTYVTARGRWYDVSWKGNVEKSGGIATNIGVHMFDLLVWLFGRPMQHTVHLHEARRMAGVLELENARVTWLLSVEARDLPRGDAPTSCLRSITVDGTAIDFSTGFSDLHTRVYERTLAGQGFGLDEARASIELASRIRHAPVMPPPSSSLLHPILQR